MPELVDVTQAAKELGVDASRVRALIADGSLDAEKIGSRWLIRWDSVVARRRRPVAPGRPMSPRNAWALLIAASGEDSDVPGVDAHTRWRIRQTLAQHSLAALDGRVAQRATAHHLWALPGELRRLHDDDALVLTGSSAAGAFGLDLAAPNTIDAYLVDERLHGLIREHALDSVPSSRANIVLREVPHDAWMLARRRVAPAAAVGLDLAGYPDSRSSRVGNELLARLDAQRRAA